MQPKTPAQVIHDALLAGMIRHRGNVKAYYDELLSKLPRPPEDETIRDLRTAAAAHLKSRR